MSVGGRHYASGGYGYKHPYRFYYSKLWDKNGTLVSDVIPVKLTMDIYQDGTKYAKDTLGLWDKITDKFIPKIGNSTMTSDGDA